MVGVGPGYFDRIRGMSISASGTVEQPRAQEKQLQTNEEGH